MILKLQNNFQFWPQAGRQLSSHKDPTCRDIRFSTLFNTTLLNALHWTLHTNHNQCIALLFCVYYFLPSHAEGILIPFQKLLQSWQKGSLQIFGKVAAVCIMSVETQLITCPGDWCHRWLTRSKNDIQLVYTGRDGATCSKIKTDNLDHGCQKVKLIWQKIVIN